MKPNLITKLGLVLVTSAALWQCQTAVSTGGPDPTFLPFLKNLPIIRNGGQRRSCSHFTQKMVAAGRCLRSITSPNSPMERSLPHSSVL